MRPTPTPAVVEALAAVQGDEYGAALAEVLDVAGPAADELARRRAGLVEDMVNDLAERLYLSPAAGLSPRERVLLRDHLARRPVLTA